ncbi:MAG: selenocysteine-specific translation elongation factor [Aggregatibacter sp.]|uniref:selenocysteine-specific translation elongation factor n=1 Tax=Aggregatibacter sp. TaxID=1872413 RepID=UPI00361BDD18
MIIVTSGHVDHGKTALLQALTGTHTAHLPEEKKRGMTIDLGYAYLPLKDKILGFIDVPGHERFLANMLAGLGGIHYAMLIVAADEGVQAQTIEHLNILSLLQLQEIIVVITKADRADVQQIDALEQQLRQHYAILANSQFFVTSATTGQGIETLRDYLAQLPELSETEKPFRYAIDRIFTIKGAGTVVTGTAFAGKVAIDDELYLSNGQKVRVKNIHAQNEQSTEGLAGQRLALNINLDFDRTLIERGDWLFSQPPAKATDRVTVWLENQIPLNESQPVHIYHAASHTTGKLTLLQQQKLAPQQQALAELILEQPLFLAHGDKIILRNSNSTAVLGGAKVIEIDSPKRHKRTEARFNYLRQLIQAETPEKRTALYLQNQAVEVEQLMWIEQLTNTQLDDILEKNGDIRFQSWCFNAEYRTQQTSKLLTALAQYHEQHPDQLGLGKARLYRIAALNQPEKLIYHFIDELLADNQLQQTRGWLHTADHKIQFNAQERALWQQVLEQFEQHNGQALWVRDLAGLLGQEESAMRNFLYKAGKLGYLTAVVKDRFFLTENIYATARLIKQLVADKEGISVNELRDALQFGRKMTVQLVEYFDRCGFLRRKGNIHVLRDADVFDL